MSRDRWSATIAVASGVIFGLWPAHGAAQVDRALSMGLTVGHVDIRTIDEPRSLKGFLYGVEGGGSWSRFYLTGEYSQGWLGAGGEGGPGRRVSAVRGALGVRVLPWVMIEGGPRFSTVELPLDDRQILRWRIGIVGRAPLVPDLVEGYASAAGSFAGTGITGAEVPDGGGGAEVGLIGWLADTVWARLAYRFDREYLPLGSSQTFESAVVAVGVSMPRLPTDGEAP